MKCKCGHEDCTTEIAVDTASHTILVSNDRVGDILVYLDANMTAEIIKRLKEMLLNFTYFKEE